MTPPDDLTDRALALLDGLEARLRRAPAPVPDAAAVRWSGRDPGRGFTAIGHAARTRLDDLLCIDRQKETIMRNAEQFMAGLPANHVLLWGPRGTGKSSLVKALFNACRDRGLRLAEIGGEALADLPVVLDQLGAQSARFLLFCDDLSFSAADAGFAALKAVLDGSVGEVPDNVLVHATSNRRHLLPEYMSENLASRMHDGELHLSEAAEEKLALSERFGIWLSFHPFTQDQYLAIVDHWLRRLGAASADTGAVHDAALRWALERGSRSGRSAWQFARDYTGRIRLGS